LTEQAPPHLLALGFCITLSLFAILFGARHISPREKHSGLVVAIAFESLVKLGALLLVVVFTLFGVFGGLGGLAEWVAANPEATEALYAPLREGGAWNSLILLAFCAAFLLPRQFHMLFTENVDPATLRAATWGLPLFLLLLNLGIPVLLWAGQAQGLPMSADYYVLGLTLSDSSGILPLLTFLGGVSAASAMMIVSTLALAAMALNHLILPARFTRPIEPQGNLYHVLLWGRRLLIVLIILLGYSYYLLFEYRAGLAQIGLISFVAVAQFLPGILGLLFWPRATRAGFLAGLMAGMGTWLVLLILPLLGASGLITLHVDIGAAVGRGDQDPWAHATFWSLTFNALLFVLGSLLTRPTPEEHEAARACCNRSIAPLVGTVDAGSIPQFEEQLTRSLGPDIAAQEVRRAAHDLGLAADETRPPVLRQLRERLERNLSGLVGPLLAKMIVDDRLRVDPSTRNALTDGMRFMEEQLEQSHTQLQGLAAELDTLRRYHRQVLHELPLGVCSVAPGGEVMIWNTAMGIITGVPGKVATGRRIGELPEPWAGLIGGFSAGEDNHLYKIQASSEGRSRWFNLHKSQIEDPGASRRRARSGLGGTVILVEDLTEVHTLESEVAHGDRLASVGRLAAGVAHEIGNPLTGIASLAQNLLYEPQAEAFGEDIRQMLEQTRRINTIVQSLMTFSHAGQHDTYQPEPVVLRETVEEAIALVQLDERARGIPCLNELPDWVVVPGDPQRLLQVFVNLLSNAVDATGPDGEVRITARAGGEQVDIMIEDEGVGIEPEQIGRIFEPFFTTKAPGQGTGLGLALVYSIVQDHEGRIRVEQPATGGTRFVISLPRMAGESAA
jgi:signal transduction histidine kinase/Na+/proline symporter